MIIAWKILVPLVLVKLANGRGVDYPDYSDEIDSATQKPIYNMSMSIYCAAPGQRWNDSCPRGGANRGGNSGDTPANKVLIFFQAVFSDGKNSTACPNDAVRPFAQLRQKCMNKSYCEETIVDISTEPGCRNRTLCLLYSCQANADRASWHIPNDFADGFNYFDHDPSAPVAAPPALGANLSPVPATAPKFSRTFSSMRNNRDFRSSATPVTPQCISYLPNTEDYMCF